MAAEGQRMDVCAGILCVSCSSARTLAMMLYHNLATCYHREKPSESYTYSMKFLQLYVNVQLSQNKKFISLFQGFKVTPSKKNYPFYTPTI